MTVRSGTPRVPIWRTEEPLLMFVPTRETLSLLAIITTVCGRGKPVRFWFVRAYPMRPLKVEKTRRLPQMVVFKFGRYLLRNNMRQ